MITAKHIEAAIAAVRATGAEVDELRLCSPRDFAGMVGIPYNRDDHHYSEYMIAGIRCQFSVLVPPGGVQLTIKTLDEPLPIKRIQPQSLKEAAEDPYIQQVLHEEAHRDYALRTSLPDIRGGRIRVGFAKTPEVTLVCDTHHFDVTPEQLAELRAHSLPPIKTREVL